MITENNINFAPNLDSEQARIDHFLKHTHLLSLLSLFMPLVTLFVLLQYLFISFQKASFNTWHGIIILVNFALAIHISTFCRNFSPTNFLGNTSMQLFFTGHFSKDELNSANTKQLLDKLNKQIDNYYVEQTRSAKYALAELIYILVAQKCLVFALHYFHFINGGLIFLAIMVILATLLEM